MIIGFIFGAKKDYTPLPVDACYEFELIGGKDDTPHLVKETPIIDGISEFYLLNTWSERVIREIFLKRGGQYCWYIVFCKDDNDVDEARAQVEKFFLEVLLPKFARSTRHFSTGEARLKKKKSAMADGTLRSEPLRAKTRGKLAWHLQLQEVT